MNCENNHCKTFTTIDISLNMYQPLSKEEILSSIFFIKDLCVYVDYKFFKKYMTSALYESFVTHVITLTDELLQNVELLNIHVCMKSLSITDFDKHRDFIFQFVQLVQTRYPNKLNKCFIYETPSIFAQMYKLLSVIMDRETKQKITIVQKS